MIQENDLQPRSTNQPSEAHLRVTTSAKKLTEDQAASLAIDLQSAWTAATSARQAFDDNLKAWTDLYEMAVQEQNWPWEDAANLVLPIVPAELDSLKSYIAAQVFVQRLVIVTPGDDDPETARLCPMVEKFYNAELRRIRRDGKTPLDHLKTVLHLGLRDGGGPLNVFFTERVEPKLVVSEEPMIVDDDVVLGEDRLPKTERVMTRVEEIVKEVNITPRLLKEWYLLPAESTSVQSALGVMETIWMTEKEMKEKVKDGIFDEESVEEVLNWVVAGMSDVASDPEGSYDKSAGDQINLGQGQGTQTSEFFANRGPAQIVRFFSEQYDMDEDGVPERNIFWFYSRTPKLLGFVPYEYVSGEWPQFIFSPLPRPDRPYGYSLVERLADIVAEANAGRNQRRNYIDMVLMPLLLQREGDTIRDKDRAFYPGAQWTVEDTDRSLKWFQPTQLSPESFQDEARLDTYVAKLTGQNAPALGAQSSGRRTATETRQQQAAQSIRSADIAMEFRSFLRAVIQFWHKLNKQYLGASDKGPSTYVSGDVAGIYGEKPGVMTLPPDVLMRNFNIDIAGLSDPVDASSRRQEIMAGIGVIAKVFPWIISDPVKSYNLAEAFFETFQWAGVERFIGTAEEAKQRKDQMAQQAAAQAALPPGGAAGPGGPPQAPSNGTSPRQPIGMS